MTDNLSTKPQSKLERELIKLRDDALRLSFMADHAVERAVQALNTHNVPQAFEVIADDIDINAFRYALEHHCYNIMATQQPTARDLRAVVTVIHISIELERIADHAVGIAKLTTQLAKEPKIKIGQDLQKMAQIARQMLKDSMDAYVNWDVDLAQQVAVRDDEVDALDKKMYQVLLDYMINDSSKINAGTYLLWSSHNLERIADHVTNICERVVFLVTGEMPVEKEG